MNLLDTNAQLRECCESWPPQRPLAIDTEFERSVTYYARPALIQISDGERTELIDPITIDEWAPLGEILEDRDRIKILHAAGEDIALLNRLCAATPCAIFDTQIAHAFVVENEKSSYQHVLAQQLGLTIAKTESRSDWLQRPLTNAQLAYALQDVHHLPALAAKLQLALDTRGRQAWVEEECARMIESVLSEQGSRQYLRLVPKIATEEAQRGLLYRLCIGREQVAAARDRPRRHVLADEALLTLAVETPAHQIELWKTGEIDNESLIAPASEQLSNRAQAVAVDCLEAIPTRHIDPRTLPPVLSKDDIITFNGTVKKMRKVVGERAEQLKLAPERIASRRMLEAFLASAVTGQTQAPPEFNGWRKPIITDQLIALLTSTKIAGEALSAWR